MGERLVCTAHPSRRTDCGSGCSGCNYLIADRRTQRVHTIQWSDQDRRILSNWVPQSYRLAGAGFASKAVDGISRNEITTFPVVLAALLISFNLLDSILTARALSMGFTEANPVMAGLFNLSLPMGMFFKSVVVGAGALFLWKVRHLQMAVRGMTAVTACYGAVILYHLYFQMLVV